MGELNGPGPIPYNSNNKMDRRIVVKQGQRAIYECEYFAK